MKADPEPHLDLLRPTADLHRPLDLHGGVDRAGCALEHGEQVVAASVHLVTAGLPHGGAHPAANGGDQRRVPIAKTHEQIGRALEIDQQERDVAARQLPLRSKLGADESDRHDPVLLRRPQEPVARPVPRGLVLEHHLAEPRERIPDVRRVVDRQATAAVRIDVREGAVGKLAARLGAEPCHLAMIAVQARLRRP